MIAIDATKPFVGAAFGWLFLGDAVGACYARASGLEVVALRFTNVVKREVFETLPWTYDPKVPLVMWAWTHEDDVVDAHGADALRGLTAPATSAAVPVATVTAAAASKLAPMSSAPSSLDFFTRTLSSFFWGRFSSFSAGWWWWCR